MFPNVEGRNGSHVHCHSHRPEVRHLEHRADHIATKVLSGAQSAQFLAASVVTGGPPRVLLTSNTRSFHMGFPSFEMGADGAETALEWGSLLSLGSTVSFKLRIFLIETGSRGVLVERTGNRDDTRATVGRRIRICLSRSEFPRAAMVGLGILEPHGVETDLVGGEGWIGCASVGVADSLGEGRG